MKITKKVEAPITKAKRFVELSQEAKILRDKLKVVNDELSIYRDDLLKSTQELGVYTLKTEDYTISRVRRITPIIEDFDVLKNTLEKENIPYETELVFKNMDALFKDVIKQERELKGLGSRETQYIMVRVNKKVGDTDE